MGPGLERLLVTAAKFPPQTARFPRRRQKRSPTMKSLSCPSHRMPRDEDLSQARLATGSSAPNCWHYRGATRYDRHSGTIVNILQPPRSPELNGTQPAARRLARRAARKTCAGERHEEKEGRLAGEDYNDEEPFTPPHSVGASSRCRHQSRLRLAKTAEFSTTWSHDTRHTAATHLIVGGTDVRTTASVLGHTTPNVTLSISAHLVADVQRAAIERFGARIETIPPRATESKPSTSLTAKNARKNGRSLVEARRLELLTLTLPA